MPRGFTLIEMLTVVAIIAVLAAVSIGAYRKYSDSARSAEAMAMIGEFKTKEAAYFTEFNKYLSTSTEDHEAWTSPGPINTLFPTVGGGSCQEPCAKDLGRPWPTACTTLPLGAWQCLGIAPTRSTLTCGYLVMAGDPNNTNQWALATLAGTKALTPLTGPTQSWFYVHAVCDNKASEVRNTEYIAPFNQTTIVTYQDHDSASPPLP
jgi:prepilin-type N-terminal cleavage/methylation domain-containing protein